MGDSLAGEAAWFGNIEIVNNSRTTTYLKNGIKPETMTVFGDCGCPNILALAGCDTEYTTPDKDEAPWYDPSIPESAEFSGFYSAEFVGLDSTFTRSITESIGDGASLGRSRYGSRTLTWKGFLFGSSCCGVAYGLRWLSSVLRAKGRCGNNCSGEDLELLVCCPTTEAAQGLGPNLICNPDFSSSTGFWTATGDTSITWDNTVIYSGKGAMKVVNPVGGSITFSTSTDCPIPVIGRKVYKLSLQVKGASGTLPENIAAIFRWYDNIGNFLGTTSRPNLGLDNDSTWSERIVTVTALPTATRVEIDFFIGDGALPPNQAHFIDSVLFNQLNYAPVVDPFRTLKGVSLIEGPHVLSERKMGTTCGGRCGGSTVVEIEFSLVGSQPWLYSTPIPVVNCVSAQTSSVPIIALGTDDCPPINCAEGLLTSVGLEACAPPVLPPTAIYTGCTAPDMVYYKAVYITAPRTLWNSISEVVPVITIQTGGLGLVGARLGFYSSADGNPCGDLISTPPTCDIICDTLNILAIPGNSKFYIDGRTNTMSLVCGTNAVFPGEPYTSGPFSWPSFDCYGFCMEFAYDPIFTSDELCISLSLVPRTSM